MHQSTFGETIPISSLMASFSFARLDTQLLSIHQLASTVCI